MNEEILKKLEAASRPPQLPSRLQPWCRRSPRRCRRIAACRVRASATGQGLSGRQEEPDPNKDANQDGSKPDDKADGKVYRVEGPGGKVLRPRRRRSPRVPGVRAQHVSAGTHVDVRELRLQLHRIVPASPLSASAFQPNSRSQRATTAVQLSQLPRNRAAWMSASRDGLRLIAFAGDLFHASDVEGRVDAVCRQQQQFAPRQRLLRDVDLGARSRANDVGERVPHRMMLQQETIGGWLVGNHRCHPRIILCHLPQRAAPTGHIGGCHRRGRPTAVRHARVRQRLSSPSPHSRTTTSPLRERARQPDGRRCAGGCRLPTATDRTRTARRPHPHPPLTAIQRRHDRRTSPQ